MAAGIYNFELEQGETWTRIVQWVQSSLDPVNLTGYSARMQVRPTLEEDDADVLLDLSTTDGMIAINGPTGTITITVPASQTGSLTPMVAHYDLFVYDPSGVATKLLKGTFTIDASVTR